MGGLFIGCVLMISFMSKKGVKFSTLEAATKLLSSMEHAINNMIEEIKKPVSPDLVGAARKAELSSIKQTVTDARELLQERQKIEEMIASLSEKGEISGNSSDFAGGFAEQFAK